MPSLHPSDAAPLGPDTSPAVVEIALLLPANRAEALIALSRRRHESIAQILRQWIDRGLATEE